VWLARLGDAWPAASSTVNEVGRFGFSGVGVGTYQLYVAPPPGSPLVGRWIGGSGDRAGATRWTVWGGGETIGTSTTTLALGASLSGRVTTAGAPLPGARVMVFGPGESWLPRASTYADTDGTWAVAGLADDTYEVLVQPPAGTGSGLWFPGVATRAEGTPVSVVAGAPVAGIDVDVPTTAAVSGRVTAPGGAGVGQVRVALFRTGAYVPAREVLTAPNGSYLAGGLAPGTYQVRFLPPEASGLGPTWLGSPTRAGSTSTSAAAGVPVTGVDQELPPA
jgi:hypothetical protein